MDAERRSSRGVAATFAILCVAVVVAWGIGRVLSDRFLLSQFFFWIPTLFAAASAWIATIALLRVSRKLALLTCVTALALSAVVLFVENRPFARDPESQASDGQSTRRAATGAGIASTGATEVQSETGGTGPSGATGAVVEIVATGDVPPLRLFHQNVNWPNRRRSVDILQAIVERDDDLIVISEPGWLLLDGRGKALEDAGWTVLRAGRFAILTRLPVIDLGSLVRRHDLDVVLLRVDGSSRELGVVTFGLVDLPSNPIISRMTLARDVRRLLASVNAPEFDVIVGDLNATRGSEAIALLFSGMHHAWDDAGTGWSASWPSPRPLWHIDHVLLAPGLEAVRYRLFDVGGLPHRAQEAWITRRESLEAEGSGSP